MRGNLSYQVRQIWNHLDGIGLPKAKIRSESSLKNITETLPVSNKVHSYEYKDEVLRTARDIGRYAFSCSIKDMTRITIDVVENWFTNKIDKDVSRDTLRNYLAHIGKIQIALESISLEEGHPYSGFTKEELLTVHATIKTLEKNGYINRAYMNAGVIVSNLSKNEYCVGILQWKFGLRVSEASLIKISQIDGTTLTFIGKGGYTLRKELSKEITEYIIGLMEDGIFKINKNHYRKSLEESSRIEGEKYMGTHGLRYNYAQEFYLKRLNYNHDELGMTWPEAHKKSLLETSEEIGHHRGEITNHYLG